MVRAIFIFLFSLIIFPYNGHADSVMSSDENSSYVEKQEDTRQQEENPLKEYASTDIATFSIDERPDGHAPIGIMGDHVHKEGEFMLSFRLMMMRMKHEVKEIRRAKSDTIINVDKNVNVDMWMGMLGLMYGLTDRWTVMAMMPYSLYSVSGGEIDHGLKDVSLSVLYAPLKENSYRMILSLEVFFPTTGFDDNISGIMEKKWNGEEIHYHFDGDVIGLRSAYAFLPKLSTLFYWDKLSLGFQLGFKYSFKIAQGDNLFLLDKSEFVDVIEPATHVWGAYNLTENFSISLRGAYEGEVFIKESFSLAGHSEHSFFSYLGLNFIGIKGHRVAFEIGLPAYEKYNIGMKIPYTLLLGWQKAF